MENQYDLLKSVRESQEKIRSMAENRGQLVTEARNRSQAELDALKKNSEDRQKQFEIESLENQKKLAEVKAQHAQVLLDIERRKMPSSERMTRYISEYMDGRKKISEDSNLNTEEKNIKFNELEEYLRKKWGLAGRIV